MNSSTAIKLLGDDEDLSCFLLAKLEMLEENYYLDVIIDFGKTDYVGELIGTSRQVLYNNEFDLKNLDAMREKGIKLEDNLNWRVVISLWKGRSVRDALNEMLDVVKEAAENSKMFKYCIDNNWIVNADFISHIKDEYIKGEFVGILERATFKIQGNVYLLNDILNYQRTPDDNFKVYIDDRLEIEIINYFERMYFSEGEKMFEMRNFHTELYTPIEKKRIEILKECLSDNTVMEDNVLMSSGEILVKTNSYPDADDIVNYGIFNYSLLTLKDKCKIMINTLTSDLGIHHAADILSEKDIIRTMKSLRSNPKLQSVMGAKGKGRNDGLLMAIVVMEEKTEKRGKTIKEKHLDILENIIRDICPNRGKMRDMWEHLNKLFVSLKSSEDKDCVECIGRVKGMVVEMMMSILFGCDFVGDDNNKRINNSTYVSEDSKFLLSKSKGERLSICDLIVKSRKENRYDNSNQEKRDNVIKIINLIKKAGVRGIKMKLSEGFWEFETNCYVEVGCKVRYEEKSESDFRKLRSMLKEESCFMSICFQKMSRMKELLDVKEVNNEIEKYCDKIKEEEFSIIPAREFINNLITVGFWCENHLKTIMWENWSETTFLRSKRHLGLEKMPTQNFSNCRYLNKAERDELVSMINEEIMDSIGLRCQVQRGLIKSQKLNGGNVGKDVKPTAEIEDEILRATAEVMEYLAIGKERRHLERNQILDKRFMSASGMKNDLNGIVKEVLNDKAASLISIFKNKEINSKNTYFVRSCGDFNEDSLLIFRGLAEKRFKEGKHKQSYKIKEISKMGDIKVGSLTVMNKDHLNVERELSSNVLLKLCDKVPKNYSRGDLVKPCIDSIIGIVCDQGNMNSEEVKVKRVEDFMKFGKNQKRDVYKKIIDINSTLLVRNANSVGYLGVHKYTLFNMGKISKVLNDNDVSKDKGRVALMDQSRNMNFMACYSILECYKNYCLKEGKTVTEMIENFKHEGFSLPNQSNFLEKVIEYRNSLRGELMRFQREKISESQNKTLALDFEREVNRRANMERTTDEEDSEFRRLTKRYLLHRNIDFLIVLVSPDIKRTGLVFERLVRNFKNLMKSTKFENNLKDRDFFKKFVKVGFLCCDNVEDFEFKPDIEPSWLTGLIETKGEVANKGDEIFKTLVFKTKQILTSSCVLVESIGKLRKIFEKKKRFDIVQDIQHCTYPTVPSRYELSMNESSAESLCRERLIVNKDFNKELLKLGCTEGIAQNMKDSNEEEQVMFNLDQIENKLPIDEYDEKEELEAVCTALGFNDHDLGESLKKNFVELKKLLRENTEYRKAIFERAIARAIVRIKSKSNVRDPFLTAEVKGFNCFIVSRPFKEDSVTYKFCIYDSLGNVEGPIFINEQKLNLLLSLPSVIMSTICSHVDNCHTDVKSYVNDVSEMRLSSEIIKSTIDTILNEVWKVDFLMIRLDHILLVNFLKSCLNAEGIKDEYFEKRIMPVCISRLKEQKKNILFEMNEERRDVLNNFLVVMEKTTNFVSSDKSAINDYLNMIKDEEIEARVRDLHFWLCLKTMVNINRKTREFFIKGKTSQPKRFFENFLNYTLKAMKENTAATNEQMQKTRFIIMHKRGVAGAYLDFGEKLFTEGRKSSIHFNRLQQLWSVIIGCFNHKQEYFCSQSDLTSTVSMRKLISEMYFNQYFSKMLLSPRESTKEVTKKVFEKVVEWDEEMKKAICQGGDECYCFGASEVEKKTVINCLLCLDVYKTVSIRDEILYCFLNQNKFASCSPKMSKKLFELYFRKNETEITNDLLTTKRLEKNDLITMAKSTGMVEKIERTVDLKDFYKKAYWEKMKKVKGLLKSNRNFDVNIKSSEKIKESLKQLEILKKMDTNELEKTIIEKEEKLLGGLKTRIQNFFNDDGSLKEKERIFELVGLGDLSRELFGIIAPLSPKGKKTTRGLSGKSNEILLSMIQDSVRARSIFFKDGYTRCSSIKDNRKERNLFSEFSQKRRKQLVGFYSEIMKERSYKGFKADKLYELLKDDEEKLLFPEQCDIIDESLIMNKLKRGTTMSVTEPRPKEMNSSKYVGIRQSKLRMDVVENYLRDLKEMFNKLTAVDLGILRNLCGIKDEVFPCLYVGDEVREGMSLDSSWSMDFDSNDKRNIAVGEDFISRLKEFLIDQEDEVEIDFFDKREEGEDVYYDLELEDDNGRVPRGWDSFYNYVTKTLHLKDNLIIKDESKSEGFDKQIEMILESFISESKASEKEGEIANEKMSEESKRRIFVVKDSRSCNVMRKVQMVDDLKRIIQNAGKMKLLIIINCELKDRRTVLKSFAKTTTSEDKENLSRIRGNLDWFSDVCRSKRNDGIPNFNQLFHKVDLINKLNILFDEINRLEKDIEKYDEYNIKNFIRMSRNKAELEDVDQIIKSIVKRKDDLLEEFKLIMMNNKRTVDVVYYIGGFFCTRGILNNGKIDSSVIPYALDIDHGACSLFSSEDVVKAFTLICLRLRIPNKDLISYLFLNSLTFRIDTGAALDISKMFIKKNFLFTFYDLFRGQSAKLKKLIKKSVQYSTRNATKSTGAILIAEKVYSRKENINVWDEMIEMMRGKKDLKHQTTIAPKNQLGAARDLKVQTLGSNIIQSSVEIISSCVYSSFSNNSLIHKSSKKKFLKDVQTSQLNVNQKKEYYYFSKDGESWGPKMKGGHIIKELSNVVFNCGFEELSYVCDVISEIWDNREAEVSGIVIDGYIRTLINRRVWLDSDLEKILDCFKDKTDRFIFKHLFRGNKTISLPIHMGQGLLQSTSTGIQAVLENCFSCLFKRMNEDVSSYSMIAASDDSAEILCLVNNNDSDALRKRLKTMCDLKQLISSSLNVNDSPKSCVSKTTSEYHSIYIDNGIEIPSKDKYTSGILMVGKDSGIKQFFESSYNLGRQLLNNSGDIFDLLQVLVGRMSSTLGTLNKTRKRELLSCLSGPDFIGGLPPFEILNWSIMKKEDFCNETKLFRCLRKEEKDLALTDPEICVLVSSFLETRGEFCSNNAFIVAEDKRINERLKDLSEYEPNLRLPREKRNLVELLMSCNRVEDPQVDVLRMKQSLVAMKRSGSLRNENNLKILSLFHRSCSHNCIDVDKVQTTLKDLIIRRRAEVDPLGKKLSEGKNRRYLVSVSEFFEACREFYKFNQDDILDNVRRMQLHLRSDIMRYSKLLDTKVLSKTYNNNHTLTKVDLFDGRTNVLRNKVINVLIWKTDEDLIRNLRLRNLDEFEIEDDYLRMKLVGGKSVERCENLISKMKLQDDEAKRSSIEMIETLVERIESKPVGFCIFIGSEMKGYHRSAQAFYETSCLKGMRMNLADNSIPEFSENSYRGSFKEIIGFICSIIENTNDAKRMIRKVVTMNLNEEEERSLRCNGSLLGSLISSKGRKDQEFYRLYKRLFDEERQFEYAEVRDPGSSKIMVVHNSDKTIYDFVLNNAAKLRFVLLEDGAFVFGCRAETQDLRICFRNIFETKYKTNDMNLIMKKMREVTLLNCSERTPRIFINSNLDVWYGNKGLPFFEDVDETLIYQSQNNNRRLVRSSITKKKYGFVITESSMTVLNVEQTIDQLNTQSRLHAEKDAAQEGAQSGKVVMTEAREMLVDRKTIPIMGSKLFSDAITDVCVKAINDDDASIIKLRRNYYDTIQKLSSLLRETVKSEDKDTEEKRLTLKETFMYDRFYETRNAVGARFEESEDGEINMVYSKRDRLQEFAEVSDFEKTERMFQIVLDKMIRDIQMIDGLKNSQNSSKVKDSLQDVETSFLTRTKYMRMKGISKILALTYRFYHFEIDKMMLKDVFDKYVKSFKDYKIANKAGISLELRQSILRKKSRNKDKDVLTKAQNRKLGLFNERKQILLTKSCEEWVKLSMDIKGNGNKALKNEPGFKLQEKMLFIKGLRSEEVVEKTVRTCEELRNSFLDKLNSVRECFDELFLHRAGEGEIDTEMELITAEAFDVEFEKKKFSKKLPVWLESGIYTTADLGRDDVKCTVLLKTHCGNVANNTIGLLLQDENLMQWLREVSVYYRSLKRARKCLRLVSQSDKKTIEQEDKEMSMAEKWFNFFSKNDEEAALDDVNTGTEESSKGIKTDSNTIESKSDFEVESDDDLLDELLEFGDGRDDIDEFLKLLKEERYEGEDQ